MKALIESIISWTKIGKHQKESYNYSIEKAVVSKETAVLSMDLRLNFVIPYHDVDRINKLIQKDFPKLKGVKFNFIYEDVILTEEEIIKHYIEHMKHEINGDYAAITTTIFPQEFTYHDHKLTIMALGEAAVKELNTKVSRLFQNLMHQNFGLQIEVTFANHNDNYMEKTKEKAALVKDELEEVDKVQRTSEANRNTNGGIENNKDKGNTNKWQRKEPKESPMVGNRIMGKDIKDEAVNIAGITVDSGLVTVEGMLFKKDSRTIKNNKKLVTLLLTDKMTSICIKLFATMEKWNDIDSSLNPGDYIKVRGNTEFDTYENVLVIMGKDIEKTQIVGRQDHSLEKRVELHVHTKMSAMDGLNEIEVIVKTAADW